MKDNKEIEETSGVILTDGQNLLAINPWGCHFIDIPKGHNDGQESNIAASRELSEEAGVYIDPQHLAPLGRFMYHDTKAINLFIVRLPKLPPLSVLKCNTFFENDLGKQVPEVSGYEYVNFDDPRFDGNLTRILPKVKKLLDSRY